MSDIKRRDFLKATAGVAAGGALGAGSALFAPEAVAQQYKVTPEKGAKLRVLRWKRFVQGDEDVWAANTKKFTELTGIEVRVDAEGWEDVRPKAAVAANVGSGPDIIISTMEDAHQYPEKLVDVSDLANYLGNKYGGWYDLAKDYGMHDKKWVAIMMGAAGNAIVYRESHVKAAGFDTVPRDMAGLPQAVPGAEGQGHAGGIRARQRDRRLELDALARLGARRQARRREEQRRHQQPGDDRRARVLEAALRDVHPGHAVVARPEQQQGVPRRPAVADRERHLGLLRREDVAGPEAAGTGQRHPARVLPGRARRQGARAEPRVPDDDLQVHEVPERGQGIPALHDGEGAVRAVAGGVDRLRLPSARGLREERVLDGGSRRRRRTATASRTGRRAATPARWATRRRRRSRTSSSRTWSRRRRRDRRRRRKRRSGRRSARSAITRYDVAASRQCLIRPDLRDAISAQIGASPAATLNLRLGGDLLASGSGSLPRCPPD